MNITSILTTLSSRSIATWVRQAKHRVVYAAPGIHPQPAEALVELASRLPLSSITIRIGFDEHTLRMGYGTLEAVEALSKAGITVTNSPGFRSGILIVDDRGWIFTPTALYLEAEPQNDETPNAVELSSSQVQDIVVQLTNEFDVDTIPPTYLAEVKAAIEIAPPVMFDVVRQVRVFEPYLQYVELSLSGAAVQRHRVRIPKVLQNLGAAKDMEGKLKTTFDLIEKGSSMSSKLLEDELNTIRKNFTPSLGKDHGRVVLKTAKPHLIKRIVELRSKLETHQKTVEADLQDKLNESKKQVVDYYFPLVKANPPDALLGSLRNPSEDEESIRSWIEEVIAKEIPSAKKLIRKMVLEENYKDVTFETLNRPDFLKSVKLAFPRVDWDKAYDEFKAAGESQTLECAADASR